MVSEIFILKPRWHDLGSESGVMQNILLSGGRGWLGESLVSALGMKSLYLYLLDSVLYLIFDFYLVYFAEDICMFGFTLLAVGKFY